MITFDEASHTYWLGEERIPSVSEVIRAGEEEILYGMEKHLERGKAIHHALYRSDTHKERGDITFDWYIDRWEIIKQEMGWEIVASEQILYHPYHKYCGTYDCLVRNREGKLIIVDFKTGLSSKEKGEIQLSAYKAAFDFMWTKEDPDYVVREMWLVILHPNANKKGYRLTKLNYVFDKFLEKKKIWDELNA